MILWFRRKYIGYVSWRKFGPLLWGFKKYHTIWIISIGRIQVGINRPARGGL